MDDDLKNKSNEELREMMRSSIDNSYVPSSIYNKAKQELEFRTQNASVKQDAPVKKEWYEKPLGIVILAVIAGLIVAAVAFYAHWV